MLLQNFVNVLKAAYFTAKVEDGTTSSGTLSITNFFNNSYAGSPYSNLYLQGGNSFSNGIHWYLAVGKGDTEPTMADYALADKTAPSEMTWLTGSIALGNNSTIWLVSNTFRNDSGSAITIKEVSIGLYQNNSNNNKGIMLARSVLDTPVTVGAGETYTFSYSIEV